MLFRGGVNIVQAACGRCRGHLHICSAAKKTPANKGKNVKRTADTMQYEPSGPGPLDCRLVAVGDVHGSWSTAEDVAALQLLKPDMVAFLGDFGNEDVALVGQIAAVPMPKAVILGNHDAWYTMIPRRKPRTKAVPAAQTAVLPDPTGSTDNLPDGAESVLSSSDEASSGEDERLPGGDANGVVQQLKLLGDTHVGFGALQVPGKNIAMVGGRPFSKGGTSYASVASFIEALYPGVSSASDSAARITQVVRSQARDSGRGVVLLAHNAPSGLGHERYDTAGVDWPSGLSEGQRGKNGKGDHGDRDLREALDQLKGEGVRVPLLLCGHMHHKLHGGRELRRMVHVDPSTGGITLNAATVPRVRSKPPSLPTSASARVSVAAPSNGTASGTQPVSPPISAASRAALAAGGMLTYRHFLVIDVQGGEVVRARDVWVEVLQLAACSAMGAPSTPSPSHSSSLHGAEDAAQGTAQSSSQQIAVAGAAAASEPQYSARVEQEQEVLYVAVGEAGRTISRWDAHFGRWVDTFVPAAVYEMAGAGGGQGVEVGEARVAEEAAAVGAQS